MNKDVEDKLDKERLTWFVKKSSRNATIFTIPPDLMTVYSTDGIPGFLEDYETIRLMRTSMEMWVLMFPSIERLMRRNKMKMDLKMAIRVMTVIDHSCGHACWAILMRLGVDSIDTAKYSTQLTMVNDEDGMYVFYDIQCRFDRLNASVPGVVRSRRGMHFVEGRFKRPRGPGEGPGEIRRGKAFGYVGKWRVYNSEVINNIRGLFKAGYELHARSNGIEIEC
jgi:hypothetical protein